MRVATIKERQRVARRDARNHRRNIRRYGALRAWLIRLGVAERA
ncbi:hypothetical protein LAV_00199 [Sphingobium phage Lacusarx]|uniref:Uncharacterized protein n=1 Tax=Sphingobium phage Lacusarx TaxID=1980139 RepID=A0A1W6DXD3_9CAUD|nr:hypothetical protein FDH44_gp104 [Sphingobium phage Lacusarx]ARK07574.1 hypothetical protein LAV_00199 [Sphingobium phage Lacusarx]